VIIIPNQDSINEAVRILKSGKLIGLPTETVYGLAADATQDIAVARIFETKNRPSFNPLIIHGSSAEVFKRHVKWNDLANDLAKAFWPGPLTLVLPRLASSSISLLTSAGLDTIAVRVPNCSIALDLLTTFDDVLAAPSANISGRISPTEALHVDEAYPELFILDGGSSPVGLESTIVDLTGTLPILLRPGGITLEDLERVIGPIQTYFQHKIKAPGMLNSHYCPTLTLTLNVLQPRQNEAYLAFGPSPHHGEHVLNLSPTADLTEAAANLFRMLRVLDKPCYEGVSVAPIPLNGMGLAVNDRLIRAAAPREPLQTE
jgi:L-threonylcarbamoyladenylate synthase